MRSGTYLSQFLRVFSTYFSKYQSQPMGFEMPGSDDYWYAILGKQDHLWVYWLHPLDLCKAL